MAKALRKVLCLFGEKGWAASDIGRRNDMGTKNVRTTSYLLREKGKSMLQILSLSILTLLLWSPLNASSIEPQTPKKPGILEGYVQDRYGNPVPYAAVCVHFAHPSVVSCGTQGIYGHAQGQTGGNGYYRFSLNPYPSCYSVDATRTGIGQGGPIPVCIRSGETAQVNIRLQPEVKPKCQQNIKDCILAGQIGTSEAVLEGLISWQDAQFECPYVSYTEIAAVRLGVSGADTFCLERVKGDLYAGRIGTADAVLQGAISWQNAQFECPYMSEAEKTRIRKGVVGAARFCR